MKSDERFDHLRIASPCPANWESMKGDDRVRFCDLCQLNVYNFAELTRKEASALLGNTEGRLCAKLYRRADGTVLTKDCPVGLRAIRRRVARISGAIFATTLSLCSVVIGQKQSKKDTCQPQTKIVRTEPKPGEFTRIAGTIYDPNGAAVMGAQITAANQSSKRITKATSKDDGTFQFINLSAGTYDLVIESPGFAKSRITDVRIDASETVQIKHTLLLSSTTVLIGIVAGPDLLDPGLGNKAIISGDTIRKLPIP